MPTFAEALYGLSTERLRSLATLREVDFRRLALAQDKRQLVQLLAAELVKPPSVSRAVVRCNARQLRLLQLMLSIEGRQIVSWPSVVEAAGGPDLEPHLADALAGIERLGLAMRAGDLVVLPDAVRHQVPTSLADHYSVAGCLQSYDAPTLRRIASNLGTGGGTKAENIDAIARRLLFNDQGTFGTIALDSEEQAVLDYIVHSGGAATAIEVASAVLGTTDDFFRYDWQNRWKLGKARNAIDRLLSRGMIYVVSYAYGFNLFLVIPGNLLRALTGESRAAFWTSPIPSVQPAADPPARLSRATDTARDAISLFGFVATQEAVRTNTGYIHRSSLKQLARMLSVPSERYAAFLYAVCRQAGLIAPAADKQPYAVTPTGRSWLNLVPTEQVDALFRAWRDGDLWGEMYNDPLKRGNEFRPTEGVAAVRRATLDLVASGPPDQFVDLASLTDALNFRYPLLLAQNTHLGDDLVPSPTSFTRLLVGECLNWLGAAELGWASASPHGAAPPRATDSRTAAGDEGADTDFPDAYRLTALGAYLLGVPDAPAPPPPPRETQFILQANAEIFLPPFLEAATLFQLMMITEPAGKGQAGNTVSLTRESIRRGLDQGIKGPDVLDFLRRHTRTGIPQNVEYLINEVSEKHGHIHLGRAQMYIHVDSPLVLKELQARREIKGYFVRTLGDTVAILNAPEPDKLLKELRKAGYLPISDDAPQRAGIGFGTQEKIPERTVSRGAPSKPGKTSASADTYIDWARIAADDSSPWEQTSTPAPTYSPQDAVRDKSNIRFLLLDAIRLSTRVQVAYQGQGEAQPQVRTIEPHRVMGNFVVCYVPLEDEEITLNINRIAWATATQEAFAPPQY